MKKKTNLPVNQFPTCGVKTHFWCNFAKLLLSLTLFLACGGGAFSFSPPSPPGQNPWKGISPDLIRTCSASLADLKNLEYIRFSSDGEAVECLWGVLAEARRSTDQADSAREFILAHADLFRLPPPESSWTLEKGKDRNLGFSHHVTFQLILHGIPVHGAFISVHFGSDSSIALIGNNIPGIEALAQPRAEISRGKAITQALRGIRKINVRVPLTCKPSWIVTKKTARKAFVVGVSSRQPLGDWEIIIDAETGHELSRKNFLLSATPRADNLPPFDAKGDVFLHHPKISPVSLEILPHLTSNGLHGQFATIENEDHSGAYGQNGLYRYSPENTHFDEVMVYFHMNRIHDYFKAMGYDRLDYPLTAVVHYGDLLDNAYYMPAFDCIVFGDGERYLPLSREESVIYHEYSHAMVSKIVAMHFGEGGAMNEGQADYFAASLSDDPDIGEYIVSRVNRPYLRTVANKTHFPEDVHNETHDDGMIWSGTLWDLRKKIGRESCDRLVQKSFYYLKEDPKFVDGFIAILQADKDHFEGKHLETIKEVFSARGFSLQVPGALGKRDFGSLATFRRLHEE